MLFAHSLSSDSSSIVFGLSSSFRLIALNSSHACSIQSTGQDFFKSINILTLFYALFSLQFIVLLSVQVSFIRKHIVLVLVLTHERNADHLYQRGSIASYASAGTARADTSVCLSVCPSVCLSVHRTPVLYQNDSIRLDKQLTTDCLKLLTRLQYAKHRTALL